MSSYLIYMLFSCAAAFTLTEPPTSNPAYIIDPLTPTQGRAILSPERAVIKLDCPQCPVFNRSWNSKATSIVYDFQIDSNPRKPYGDGPASPHPAIILNEDTFYPPSSKLGFTPFTAHTARPVPWDTSISAYAAKADQYETADLVGIVDELPVPNEHGWNLTFVSFTTFAYGTNKENRYENHWGNISVVGIFLQRKNVSNHGNDGQIRLHNSQCVTEQWTLEWWQIVPIGLAHLGEGLRDNYTAAKLPDGLKDKLLRKGSMPSTATPTHTVQRLGRFSFVAVTIVIVLFVAFCLARLGTMILGSTRTGDIAQCVDNKRTQDLADEEILIDEKTKEDLYRDVEPVGSPPMYEECVYDEP